MALLAQLSASCKETVHLAILRDFQVFYFDKVEGQQSISILQPMGRQALLTVPGVGKVLLAYLKEKELDAYLQSVVLTRYTPNTICNTEDLKRYFMHVKDREYATDDCEHEHDVRCVEAPLRDRKWQVIAFISLVNQTFESFGKKLRENIFWL